MCVSMLESLSAEDRSTVIDRHQVVWMETNWILQGVKLLSPILDLYLYMDSSFEVWGSESVAQMLQTFGAACSQVGTAAYPHGGTVKTVLLLCDKTAAVSYLQKEEWTLSPFVGDTALLQCVHVLLGHQIPSWQNALTDTPRYKQN